MNKIHTFLILKYDLKSSLRGMSQRLGKHLFTTIFSLFLIVPFMAAVTGVIIYMITEETLLSEMLSPKDFFFTVFVLVAGRAGGTTLRHVYRDPTIEVLRIIPLPPGEIYKGKLFSVMVITLQTFTIFYIGFFTFFILLYPDPILSSVLLIYTFYFYLITIFATITGFAITLVYYLPWELRKTALGYISPALVGGVVLIFISDLELTISSISGRIVFPVILSFFTFLLMIIIMDMHSYFNEAMHHRIPKSQVGDIHFPRLVRFIRAFSIMRLGRAREQKHRNIVAAKEFLSTMRDSYFYIYAGMTALLTVMGVLMIQTMPSRFLDSNWGWLVYPVLISFFLYIEGSFMVTLGSISLIGKEGKRLWVLRSLPISGYDVLSGKAISVIIPSVIGGFIMVIPLLHFTGLPAGQSLIFLVFTLCVILSFSGVGIMAGARYPNFTEGARGSPDIVFQLFILFICLILLCIIIVPPMTFYYNYGWISGFIVSMMVLFFTYAVFIAGVRVGERIFNRLSSEDYEKG